MTCKGYELSPKLDQIFYGPADTDLESRESSWVSILEHLINVKV